MEGVVGERGVMAIMGGEGEPGSCRFNTNSTTGYPLRVNKLSISCVVIICQCIYSFRTMTSSTVRRRYILVGLGYSANHRTKDKMSSS
jgi:hypothetical protein